MLIRIYKWRVCFCLKCCFVVYKRKSHWSLDENTQVDGIRPERMNRELNSKSCSAHETEISKKSNSSTMSNHAKTEFINKVELPKIKKTVLINTSKNDEIIIWV